MCCSRNYLNTASSDLKHHPSINSLADSQCLAILLQEKIVARPGQLSRKIACVGNQPVHSVPSVSVILATKNDVKFIAETIESILNQKYPNLQLHVQDGVSTDGTLDILRRYPIQFKSEPDRSVADAFNRGFHNTTGEVLIFLGGDDPLLPDSISILATALAKNPKLGFAYGDTEYIDGEGKPFFLLRGRPFDLDEMFWRNSVPSQSVAVRREALNRVGLYSMNNHMCDWEVRLRMGAQYPSLYIPKTLAQYRVHSESFTIKHQSLVARNVCEMVERCLAEPEILNCLRHSSDRARAGALLIASRTYVLGGDIKDGWSMWTRALRIHVPSIFHRSFWGTFASLILRQRGYSRIRQLYRRTTTLLFRGSENTKKPANSEP